MAIVSASDILDYLEVEEGEESDLIEVVHLAVEKLVKNYCHRDFEVTSYRERYNGDGSNTLVLDNFPVTAITRLALWPLDVIMIKNTNTYTVATISTSSTNLILTKDGTSTSLAFSTYSTFTTLVAAVNALSADGWSAQVVSSTYDNYRSVDLIEKMGLYCLESNWAYLQMPYNKGEMDFDIDSNKGIIYLNRFSYDDKAGFPIGTRNIFVDYSAGYSTMPVDLTLAVKILTKYIYERTREGSFGYTSFNLGDITGSFQDVIPVQVKMILDFYRRINLNASR